MNWYPIGASRGEHGWGDETTYLVTVLEHEVRLSRFRSPGTSPLDMAVEAARNVIVFPLGRGPGRPGGEPELAALAESAKTYAERFEAGESLEGYPAWQREQPKARRHFHAPFEVERECFKSHDLSALDYLADLRAADGHVPDYNRAEADRRLREMLG
jgi:hypothetical protein